MTTPSLIPEPLRFDVLPSPATLSGAVAIRSEDDCAAEVRYLRRLLEGLGIEVVSMAEMPVGAPVIHLEVADLGGDLAGRAEAYRLHADAEGIVITGNDRAGLFRGIQTLRQLMPDWTLRRAPIGPPGQPIVIGGAKVEDAPCLAWRGLHLDVSRHFMPKEFVLKVIDLAAFHKCNVFHFHLTDDQGWRVPIPGYPRLTEVGAWRRESPVGHWSEDLGHDGVPHGGWYSREDLEEIVAFAAERHVTVLPEIDMPGHMVAAIAAYPELGNSGKQLEVHRQWGISKHVLNLEPVALTFCRAVLDEIASIFPSPWVHVGGDECPTIEWEASPSAQALKSELGLKDERQLQGWFTAQMAEHLAGLGRRLIGWDEILEGGAPQGAVIMSWQGEEGGVEAASAGHDVVMAPQQWLYFDWGYAEDDPAEPLSIGGATTTELVYSYDPVASIPESQRHHVLGAQCQLWTEYVTTTSHAEYQYFPRVCAFAEMAWTGPSAGRGASWQAFESRLERHLGRLGALGVAYRPLDGPTPGQARVWRG